MTLESPLCAGHRAPHHILVVDDDPGVRETLEIALGCQGHDVTTADCGRAAIDIVRTRDVDLVLTDLRMGEMDGITTLRALRMLKPGTRVIVLTGYASDEVREELEQCGVGVFLKPFALQDLYAAIRNVLDP